MEFFAFLPKPDKRMLVLGLFLAAGGVACGQNRTPKPGGPAKTAARPFGAVARKLVAALNAQNQTAMQQLFAPAMQQALPAEKAGPFFQGVLAMRGKIGRIGPPQVDNGISYLRLGAERGVWDLQLQLDAQNRISSLLVQAAGPNFALATRNAAPMKLPFRGTWKVFWGGARRAQNYHVISPAQRRAIDFVITDQRGQSFRSNGVRNADFYAYGQEILAAAAGTVVKVTDGVPENLPGQMGAGPNGPPATGNCVVVRQNSGEFAFFAHLQPGSIRVKIGDKIQAEQVLGLCGNSGHSSEPHLHFHLQNTPELNDGSGIAPYFRDVRLTRKGKTSSVSSYFPLRGDQIRAEK